MTFEYVIVARGSLEDLEERINEVAQKGGRVVTNILLDGRPGHRETLAVYSVIMEKEVKDE